MEVKTASCKSADFVGGGEVTQTHNIMFVREQVTSNHTDSHKQLTVGKDCISFSLQKMTFF